MPGDVSFAKTHRTWCGKRPARWLPRRECGYRFVVGRWEVFLTWTPFKGIRWSGERLKGTFDIPTPNPTCPVWERSVKRRTNFAITALVPPAASPTSVLLVKLPALREFLSATAYDDGSVRTPGTLRLTSIYGVWEGTMQDPDAAARITAKDASLDKLLLLLEQVLGAEEAPWETDRYLAEKQAKKAPRKK